MSQSLARWMWMFCLFLLPLLSFSGWILIFVPFRFSSLRSSSRMLSLFHSLSAKPFIGHLFENIDMCACMNVCVNSLDFILFTSSIPFTPTVNWSPFLCAFLAFAHFSCSFMRAIVFSFNFISFFSSSSFGSLLRLCCRCSAKIEADNEHTLTLLCTQRTPLTRVVDWFQECSRYITYVQVKWWWANRMNENQDEQKQKDVQNWHENRMWKEANDYKWKWKIAKKKKMPHTVNTFIIFTPTEYILQIKTTTTPTTKKRRKKKTAEKQTKCAYCYSILLLTVFVFSFPIYAI